MIENGKWTDRALAILQPASAAGRQACWQAGTQAHHQASLAMQAVPSGRSQQPSLPSDTSPCTHLCIEYTSLLARFSTHLGLYTWLGERHVITRCQ